ncbi:MAG: diguanylate cyclase [Ferruginibacter sp.]|nr:diguanylate cyclase [Rhodoferax sp.]
MKELKQRPLARLGIGPRIVFIFAVVFALMGSLGLALMKNSLLPAFDSMEQRFAQDSAKRVLSGFDEQLSGLSVLTRDWAFWDELYQHVQHPSKAFERSNIGPAAMLTSNLNAVLFIDLEGQSVGWGMRTMSSGVAPHKEELLESLQRLWAVKPVAAQETQCGLVQLQKILSAICWSPIFPSDGHGTAAGMVVMAREFNDSALATIAQNAGAHFSIEPNTGAPAVPGRALRTWELSPFVHLANRNLTAAYDAKNVTLDYQLQDMESKPLALVRMRLQRELAAQAQRVVKDVAAQLAAVALGTGLVLLVSVQIWLVRPIRRLQADLASLTASRRWDSALAYERPDEIGALTQGVNALLRVLHDQVQALENLSSTDALTGIANRRQFDERLNYEVVRLVRHPAPLSLLMMDVDHFKRYNDLYGHPMGDTALQKIGVLLKNFCRQQDLPARIGGEEFALLLLGTDAAGAIAVAEKLRLALYGLAIAHDHSPTAPYITASIGIATWGSDHRGEASGLLVQADEALYAAKRNGRNRVHHRRYPDLPGP